MSNEAVEVGKDGWLFLAGGSNPYLTYLRGEETLGDEVISGWRDLLESRHKKLASQGVRYLHLFAPEKATVYADKLENPIRPELSHIARLADAAKGLFLDVVPYFRSQRKSLDLYHKTDSHWNFYGAFSAFQLVMAELSKKVPDSILKSPSQKVRVAWDLGAKLEVPVSELSDIRDIALRGRRVWANDLVQEKERTGKPNEGRLHVGSVVIFRNENPLNSERVVVFGDSFSEYRPHLFTAMLAESFSEVHFVWSSEIDYEYVDLVKPDLVISELAERFLRLVPKDKAGIPELVKRQLCEYRAETNIGHVVAVPAADELAAIRVSDAKVALKPDIIIAGSMKCGTTILYDFLTSHERIARSTEKEIHYFSLNFLRGDDWYGKHFEGAGERLKLDASPTYFDMTYGHPLPSLMRAQCPKAKIIICLRDPVERAISHFRHLKEVVKAPGMDAFELEKVFVGDLNQKYWGQFSSSLKYGVIKDILDFGMYSRKLMTFKSIFGRDVLVILNEDLWRDPQQTMKRVFDHVGLDFSPSPTYESKKYVTRGKSVSDRVRRSLKVFYSAEIELLAKDFGINFNDAG